LKTLSDTRDRPIFSPNRRPPPPAVAINATPKAAPPPKRDIERPQFLLVGTISGDNEGFGIFVDAVSKTALRLRVGEAYQGWKLRTVNGREVTLEKDRQAAILALPQHGVARPDGDARLLPADAPASLVGPPAEPLAEH
jgi:general secretion pathway protein N